jgi:hypothetical protein
MLCAGDHRIVLLTYLVDPWKLSGEKQTIIYT